MTMNETDLTYFRLFLKDWHEQLLRQAGITINELYNSAGVNESDPLDRASLEVERNFNLRIRDRERRLIYKIRNALMRIDEGRYGVCEACGEAIGIHRLKARPVTNYCITCKEESEATERIQGR
jgi:DnaK suppressor protein